MHTLTVPYDNDLTIKILGYQFPDIYDGYDANWLNVAISTSNELGKTSITSACLLTWEIKWLELWTQSVVADVAKNLTTECGLS